MKTKIDVIMGNAQMDRIMHAMDMFEPGKIMGSTYVIEIKHSKPLSKKMLLGIKAGLEEVDNVIVSFMGVKGKKTVYFKAGIQSISNGKNWVTLPNLLKVLGYSCKTDEHMRVISITNNLTT